MLVTGITIAMKGALKGWEGYIPLAVGAWLPFGLVGWLIFSRTPGLLLFMNVYSAIAWTLMALVVLRQHRDNDKNELVPIVTASKPNLFYSFFRKPLFILLVVCLGIAATGFKSNSDRYFKKVNFKEVPDAFVGSFLYITQTGGYVNQYGQHIPGVAQGVTLTINRDGSGSSLYHVETGSYAGTVTIDEIRMKCRYEITKTGPNTANVIIHYLSGQNYHNGVLRNNLDASKLYPNGDAVWNDVEIGVNPEGKTIFTIGQAPNTAQFTKQAGGSSNTTSYNNGDRKKTNVLDKKVLLP
jgi:hypothetical protein